MVNILPQNFRFAMMSLSGGIDTFSANQIQLNICQMSLEKDRRVHDRIICNVAPSKEFAYWIHLNEVAIISLI